MIRITSFLRGPYMIVVTDPQNPNDEAYPAVVAPEGGYETKEAAVEYIQQNYLNRKTPYLGLHFNVAPFRTETSFGHFCSWED